MSFLNKAEVIGVVPNVLYTVPAGFEISIHGLVLDNPSGIEEVITVSLYNQATGLTNVVETVILAANSAYTLSKALNLTQQDYITLVSTGAATTVMASVYQQSLSGANTAIVLVPRGAWSSIATYVTLDMVDSEGSSYVAMSPNNNSQPPGVNWGLVASRGTIGTVELIIGGTNIGVDSTDPAFPVIHLDTSVVVESVVVTDKLKAIGDLNINVAAANVQTKTISVDSVFTFSDWTADASIVMLELTTAGTEVITWTGVTWDEGAAPDTETFMKLIFTSVDGGTTVRGSSIKVTP